MYDSVMPMHEQRELPRFTLREIDMPEVVEWEVGSQHYIIVKAEMVGKRNRKDGDMERVEGNFEVRTLKALGDKPVDVKTLEQQEFEKTVAKAKSGEI